MADPVGVAVGGAVELEGAGTDEDPETAEEEEGDGMTVDELTEEEAAGVETTEDAGGGTLLLEPGDAGVEEPAAGGTETSLFRHASLITQAGRQRNAGWENRKRD